MVHTHSHIVPDLWRKQINERRQMDSVRKWKFQGVNLSCWLTSLGLYSNGREVGWKKCRSISIGLASQVSHLPVRVVINLGSICICIKDVPCQPRSSVSVCSKMRSAWPSSAQVISNDSSAPVHSTGCTLRRMVVTRAVILRISNISRTTLEMLPFLNENNNVWRGLDESPDTSSCKL